MSGPRNETPTDEFITGLDIPEEIETAPAKPQRSRSRHKERPVLSPLSPTEIIMELSWDAMTAPPDLWRLPEGSTLAAIFRVPSPSWVIPLGSFIHGRRSLDQADRGPDRAKELVESRIATWQPSFLAAARLPALQPIRTASSRRFCAARPISC